jgi:hypothetical protein
MPSCIYVPCEFCSQSFGAVNKTVRFCSTICYISHKWEKETIPKILNGVAGKKSLKKYLLETRENQCSSCSLSEWMGQPLTMDMDHIDGNSSNNTLENVRLLCPNCHSLTPTYKAKNIGNGPKSRC